MSFFRKQSSQNDLNLACNAAIIVAAGSSQRFGQDKLMVSIQGRSLISYSLEAFAAISSIKEIVLVVAAGRTASFHELLKEMNIAGFSEKVKIISGGKNRHDSVQNGLRALSSGIEWVAIHDGARPLISRAMIESVFQKANEYGAAALAAPVTETLHRASSDQFAAATVDRKNLWAMQTPQVFCKADLMSLDVRIENESPTDEVSALLQRGKKIYLVKNSEPNIKVTYPEDLALVRACLRCNCSQ